MTWRNRFLFRVGLRWFEIRSALRRYAWLDFVEAAMLVLWGLSSLLTPDAVVKHSHFGSLGRSISLAGAIALLAGLAQGGAALTHPQEGSQARRSFVSFVGLWVMVSLWFSVSSITGKISWGGHVSMELLICLALVP